MAIVNVKYLHANITTYKLQEPLIKRDNLRTSIMVVDDDRDILTVAGRGLQYAGFKVYTFADPLEALQHVQNGCKDCDVLVSDVRMPALTGFQLIRKVKDLRPEIKVVLMTMFEVNKREFEAVFPSTPIDDVIRKPFAPSQLVGKIRGFLGLLAQTTTPMDARA
jgi:two-component system OmpR family response regulator